MTLIQQKTCTWLLILALFLSACGRASSPVTVEPAATPIPAASQTPDQPVQLTPGETSITPPTEPAASTATPAATAAVDDRPVFMTGVGELVVESSAWMSQVNGVRAEANEKLLLIVIGKPDVPRLDRSNFSLQAFDVALRDQSLGEVHISGDDGSYSVCSMAGWVGAYDEVFAMGFRIPKTAQKVQLNWPGNDPIDLDPYE